MKNFEDLFALALFPLKFANMRRAKCNAAFCIRGLIILHCSEIIAHGPLEKDMN